MPVFSFNSLRNLKRSILRSRTEPVRSILERKPALVFRVPSSHLLLICQEGVSADILRLLLDAGWKPDPEVRDAMGRTPLHLCVEMGRDDLVDAILQLRANPNSRDRDGVTPLNLCKSFSGTGEIAEKLRAAGGDPLLVDKTGKNYLM
ncbi:MAG: ankyrin repeat domain-containing protein [Leptospiraceae bacterium]|nr:ankyrin repeat domain-containing protein [Leptospiraceae bacterium]